MRGPLVGICLTLALVAPPSAASPIRFEEIGAAAGARVVHHTRAFPKERTAD